MMMIQSSSSASSCSLFNCFKFSTKTVFHPRSRATCKSRAVSCRTPSGVKTPRTTRVTGSNTIFVSDSIQTSRTGSRTTSTTGLFSRMRSKRGLIREAAVFFLRGGFFLGAGAAASRFGPIARQRRRRSRRADAFCRGRLFGRSSRHFALARCGDRFRLGRRFRPGRRFRLGRGDRTTARFRRLCRRFGAFHRFPAHDRIPKCDSSHLFPRSILFPIDAPNSRRCTRAARRRRAPSASDRSPHRRRSSESSDP